MSTWREKEKRTGRTLQQEPVWLFSYFQWHKCDQICSVCPDFETVSGILQGGNSSPNNTKCSWVCKRKATHIQTSQWGTRERGSKLSILSCCNLSRLHQLDKTTKPPQLQAKFWMFGWNVCWGWIVRALPEARWTGSCCVWRNSPSSTIYSKEQNVSGISAHASVSPARNRQNVAAKPHKLNVGTESKRDKTCAIAFRWSHSAECFLAKKQPICQTQFADNSVHFAGRPLALMASGCGHTQARGSGYDASPDASTPSHLLHHRWTCPLHF